MSFTPILLAALLSSPTAVSTYTSNCVTTFGATDGTNQSYAGAYHSDTINTVATKGFSTSAILHEVNETASATFTSFSSGQAVITWDNTGTAYQTAWFAAGDSPATGDVFDFAGEFKTLRVQW